MCLLSHSSQALMFRGNPQEALVPDRAGGQPAAGKPVPPPSLDAEAPPTAPASPSNKWHRFHKVVAKRGLNWSAWKWALTKAAPKGWMEKAATCGMFAGAVVCLREGVRAGGGYLTAGVAVSMALRNHREKTKLQSISKEFERQLTRLQESIGAVGDARDGMMERLDALWAKQKSETDRLQSENARHAALLDGQARLELLRVMQLFDVDRDVALSAEEMQRAQTYLRGVRELFPRGDLGKVLGAATSVKSPNRGTIRLDEIERQLLPSASAR